MQGGVGGNCVGSYALSNIGWQLRQKGDLDGYLASQAEQKRFFAGGSVDAGTTNANEAVSAAAKRVVADRDSKLADLMGQYVAKLEAAIKELVVGGRIEDAKVAKAEAGKIAFEKADLESRQTNIGIRADASSALPPLDLGQSLRGDVRTDRDREFVELKVDGAQVVRDMCWNPTNKNVLVLNKRGQLRQISVPDIKETALLELNVPAVRLQQSSQGIIVLVDSPQSIVVISPLDLGILKRIPVPDLVDVAASPGSPVVVGVFGPHRRELGIVDLATGRVTKIDQTSADGAKSGGRSVRSGAQGSLATKSNTRRDTRGGESYEGELTWPFSFARVHMSQDGSCLFSADSFGFISRFAVQKNMVRFEQKGNECMCESSDGDFCVSPTAQYVALPVYISGNRTTSDSYWVYIYRANDLSKPIMKLIRLCKNFGFAHSGRTFYGQGMGRDDTDSVHLVEMTADGSVVSDSPVTLPKYEGFRQILPLPSAQYGELLFLTGTKLYWTGRKAPANSEKKEEVNRRIELTR